MHEKQHNIIVVNGLIVVNIEIPTPMMIHDECDGLVISRDYYEDDNYGIKNTSGRLFSLSGVNKPMFTVNGVKLILKSIDLISIC
jgi:hypothetical protein